MSFTFEVRESIEETIFIISGRFDAFESPNVAAKLNEIMKTGRYNFTVDLSQTIFIDSTALAELVKAMRRSRQFGGDLTLRSPSEPVSVILELTALDKAFVITADRRLEIDQSVSNQMDS